MTCGRVSRIVLLLACLSAQVPGLAFATPELTNSSEDEARRAFREGTEAAETERWADSERAFRRAFELSHAASALFNQAVALRALGRHVEAHQAFTELLSGFPELSRGMRTTAERLLSESGSRIATLELSGLDLSPYQISIDGRPVRDALTRPLRIELDEGSHDLRVQKSGSLPFTWQGVLRGSEVTNLDIKLVPVRPETSRAQTSHARLYWWIGGATAFVAAGVIGGFFIVREREDGEQVTPRTTNVFEVP